MQKLITDLHNFFYKKSKLPGEEAQTLMAPSYRFEDMEERTDKARKSAVLILLYPKNEQWYICFIQRVKDGGVHSGQIALPGGKTDKTDKNIIETAYREAYEEIGIDKNKINYLGELSHLFIPVSNYIVFPVVGYLNSFEQFRKCPKEVNQVIEVRLIDFFNPKNKQIKTREIKNIPTKVPYYLLANQYYLWGATAMIMSEFEVILKQASNWFVEQIAKKHAIHISDILPKIP